MNKKKLARRISGKQKGHFSSDEWKDRKSEIARRVEATEEAAKKQSPMKVKLNTVYKNRDGEYFNCTEKDGKLVLSNPSYPFVFLPEVQAPLEEIGDHKEFKHLIKKEDSTFIEGNSLTVEIDTDGNLIPVK